MGKMRKIEIEIEEPTITEYKCPKCGEKLYKTAYDINLHCPHLCELDCSTCRFKIYKDQCDSFCLAGTYSGYLPIEIEIEEKVKSL